MSHANGDDTAAANGHADDTLPETVPPDDGDDFESDSDDDSANANSGYRLLPSGPAEEVDNNDDEDKSDETDLRPDGLLAQADGDALPANIEVAVLAARIRAEGAIRVSPVPPARPQADDFALTEENANAIRSAMQNFALPPAAIPPWARTDDGDERPDWLLRLRATMERSSMHASLAQAEPSATQNKSGN